MIEFVTVFCASSNRIEKYFLNSAYELGKILAINNYKVIYGGGKVGLMGKLAEGVLSNKGQIIGVIPRFMQKFELVYNGLTKLIETETIHEREEIMIRKANCIVALPGGCGTMEELLQSITWKRLGLTSIPIIIANLKNYFSPLIEQLNRSVEQKFMRPEHSKLWLVGNSVEEVFDLIRSERAKHYQLRFDEIQPNLT
ncbi:MAG: LOG family protein [Candidatus Kapaibacteriales bacterium]